jgi:SAM-dependent methyltransferase
MAGSFRREEVRDYEKRRYRGWDQRLVDRRERRIVERLLRSASERIPAGVSPGRSTGRPPLVLDIPCGYGRLSDLVLASGARLVSADLSPAMVERAMQNAGPAASAGVVADLTRGLPFRAGAFDAVLCMRLFHHLHDAGARAAALAELGRAASAAVILSYYRRNRLHVLQRKLRRALKGKAYEIKMAPGREFEAEAAAAGFEVDRSVPLFRGLHAQRVVLLRPRT